MPKQIISTKLKASVRKAHEFVLEAHRHAMYGYPTEGLRSASNIRIAAIELRNYLDYIISTEKND